MATSASSAASGRRVHFSKHFGIAADQSGLDFVDIPLNTDGPLFLDPYAFKLNNDPWSIDCNNLLVDFFQTLLDAIRNNDHNRAKDLMLPLREPNETRLGFSAGTPAGRGMGETYNMQLLRRLGNSQAAKSGYLHDLCDCELLIPHISSDRISDITVNVIRHKLIEYTQAQCKLYEVPTKLVPTNVGWSPDQQFWVSRFDRLPVYRHKPIILVPKWAVRRKMTYDHQEYWRHWCLEFLKQEHLHAGTALVRTLKSGKKKVYTKDVKRELPCDKETLAKFSAKHPDLLKRYKEAAPNIRSPLSDQELSETLCDDGKIIVVNVNDGGTVVNTQNIVQG